MDLARYAPLIGIIGLLLGALASYFFGKKLEDRKIFMNIRRECYIDFIKATSIIAISQRKKDNNKEYDDLVMLTDAKVRISVYGSDKVVKAMAGFFRFHGALDSPTSYQTFVELVWIMRKETAINGSRTSQRDIGQLILGLDLNDLSEDSISRRLSPE